MLELDILESNLFDIFGDTAPIKVTRLDDFDCSLGDLNVRLLLGGMTGV